jgi:xylulokinase
VREEPLVLGLDLGSTEVRVGLFDLHGRALHIARRPHATTRGGDGSAEQDVRAWWRGIVDGVAELGDVRARVAAVCATGQGPTLVAAAASGAPVRPALTWMDTRPARHVADDPDGVAGFTLRPAIRWLERSEPRSVERAAWLLNSWDWLALRLSGIAATSLQPDEAPLTVRGLAGRLGPGVPVGQVLGPLTRAAARELGLAPTTVVVAGTNDGAATIVGSGLREPGDAVDVGGASGGLAILGDGPVDLPGIYCAPSLLPGRWILGGAMMALGASLEWLRTRVLGDERPLDDVIDDAATVPAGAGGLVFLPYLAGERSPIWDDAARGAFVGLRVEHDRADLVRSVLEGGAFALRSVAQPLADAGHPIGELRLSGRPASSAVWAQVKSDVLGVPVVIPAVRDAGVLGAATIAAAGIGLFPDLATAAGRMFVAKERLEPDPSARGTYDRLFSVYSDLYPALRPSFRGLALASEAH